MNLFPPEIVNHSTQSHFVENFTQSKIIYMLLIICILVFSALLPFIVVDVTTQTRGIIRTQSENTQLQCAVYGEVKQVILAENIEVKKGNVLLVINTDKLDEQEAKLNRDLQVNKSFISDLNALINEQGKPQTAKYQFEYAHYNSKVKDNNIQLRLAKKEYDLNKQLYEKEVIAQMEFNREKNKYEVLLSQFLLLKKQFKNQWQAELTKLKQQNNNIKSEIEQLQNEKQLYVIKAPVAGIITNVAGIKPGSFVVPNQVVAQISPNENLLVECYVSPADIGFIKEQQKINFQLDAFNYNQWGMATGNVTQILNDISYVNDQPFFKVRCELDSTFLQLKTGYKGQLKKGMTLTGRFYLTERTLWQLLFDKVDDWMNPKLISS